MIVICSCSSREERRKDYHDHAAHCCAGESHLIFLICYAKRNWTTFLFSLFFQLVLREYGIRSKQLKSLQKDIMPFSLLWDHPFPPNTFCAHIKFYAFLFLFSPSNSKFICYFSFFSRLAMLFAVSVWYLTCLFIVYTMQRKCNNTK